MKNKQINKVLLMFFLSFTLFFSVSNAAIVANQSYLGNNAETTSSIDSSSTYVEGYTYSLVDTILTNYVSDTTNETYINDFNNMISAFENAGKNVVVFRTKYSSKNYACIVTYDSDSNVCFGSPLNRIGFILDDTSQTKTFNLFCNRQFNFYNITCTAERPYALFSTYQCYEVYYASTDIYQLTQSSSWLFSWDGTSYYYKAPEKEPDVPSANYDLAGIIDVIKNSSEVQDNIYPYLEEYFIIPDGTVGNEEVYEIYFYYPSVNLSQFEYVFNDSLYYDLDKTSIDGVISNLTYYLGGDTKSNVVKDVQMATLYYDPETGSGDIYLTSTMTLNELKSFNSETQPIIYTTKDIAYYSATWGETDTEWTATANESKNVLTTEIVDSEGNVVDPMLPSSSTAVLGETPFERFVNVIRTAILGLGETVSQGLIDFTDYLLNLFGENVVTFMFLIVIKSVTVLVSSVALIFRFVSFIMTLVAIPASSALLSIDVATNTSGLVFTGLNWGSRFIEGLNLFKSFQWNGLGLWTLFEVFVASLEVVFFVKIVRKHYRNL